jgi:hypothetical protein
MLLDQRYHQTPPPMLQNNYHDYLGKKRQQLLSLYRAPSTFTYGIPVGDGIHRTDLAIASLPVAIVIVANDHSSSRKELMKPWVGERL